MAELRRLLESGDRAIRVLEVHNGLTGLIAERTSVQIDGDTRTFDAMWISSLTDSVAKGKPDIELVDVTSRVGTIEQVLEVTTKPIIVDGDSGGLTEHFVFTVRTLERLGVSAVIIEDKIGPKRNSLFGTQVEQTQDSIEDFADKIASGKRAQVTDEFMIIARIESLVLGRSVEDALERATAYIGAGVDGIMIHSSSPEPAEILDFCARFRRSEARLPLVVVPTTYNSITERELAQAGVNVVIHANHMLRSAYPAMQHVAELILRNERSLEADELCVSIPEVLRLVPHS
jgi:phosphoenolpyruvate phosphomutase / 2-hydroxyethylphosphonate cytidylyltransferase